MSTASVLVVSVFRLAPAIFFSHYEQKQIFMLNHWTEIIIIIRKDWILTNFDGVKCLIPKLRVNSLIGSI